MNTFSKTLNNLWPARSGNLT